MARAVQEQAYIAGPMRGFRDFNFGAFDCVADHCRRVKKWHTHSPAEHDRETWPEIESWPGYATGDVSTCPAFDLKKAMAWDLARVAESQHLVLLPGWEESSGARAERRVAEETGSLIWLARIYPGMEGASALTWYLETDTDQLRITAPPVKPLKLITHEADDTPEDFARDLAAVRNHASGFAQPDDFVEQTGPYARGVDSHALIYGLGVENRRCEGDDIEALEADSHKMAKAVLADCYATAIEPVRIGGFTTKDSGERKAFESGMVRDTDEGKPRYDLIPLLPLTRLAELYARGAVKYGDRNWQKANSAEELQRFKASAFRHFVQWLNGEVDEDHGIATAWNIFAVVWLEHELTVTV